MSPEEKAEKYQVLNDNLLVLKNKKPEQITVSGIYIAEPENVEKYIESGVILKTGDGKWNQEGTARIPLVAKVGDTVYFNTKGAIRFLPTQGEEYYLVMEKDLYCIVQ
jgi:chaperonin GroES